MYELISTNEGQRVRSPATITYRRRLECVAGILEAHVRVSGAYHLCACILWYDAKPLFFVATT